MKLQVLKNLNELEKISNNWSDLFQSPINNKIYFSYMWFVSSYKTFHSGDDLHVIVIRDDKMIKCIAPLVITKEKHRFIKLNKICFPRNNQNPSNDFLYSSGCEGECFEIVMDHLCEFTEWNMIDLQMINKNGCTSILLKEYLEKNKINYGEKANRVSPYIKIEIDWTDFWNSRSVKFRKNMRNKINKAEKTGYVVVKKKFIENDTNALDDMLNISSKSWKKSIGTDLLSQKDNWTFYKELCACFGPFDSISLYLLKLDGVPAAFEFHIEDQDVAYPVRADYDQEFEKLSPGSILEYEIIKQLFEKKHFKEYNSCGHTYTYLMNWTDMTREFVNYEIFINSLFGKMIYYFEYILLPQLRNLRLYDVIKKKIINKN